MNRMNKLYEKVKLYFVNKRISNLEKEKEQILSQKKVDMPLQGLLVMGYLFKDISKKLFPLYEHKKTLTNKLSLLPSSETN